MERLTARKDDGVVYLKDNAMIWPVNMSGFDVRQVMEKLADYEDIEEEKGCGWCKQWDKPEKWECCVLDEKGNVKTVGDHVAMCISADFCPVCGKRLHQG